MEPTILFSAINKLHVLIVGDVMIDRYLNGQVDRVSPEAPVPIVRLQTTENRLGGAANVAINIRAMGATPYLCSVIGMDKAADTFTALLPQEGIMTPGILRSEKRGTTVKTRVIAANQHLLRIDEEDTFDLTDIEQRQLLSSIRQILNNQKIDVILFQDYNKGVLSLDFIQAILNEAVRLEIPTIVDPKYYNFLEYKGVTLFKPNLKEVREALPFNVEATRSSLTKASEYLRTKLSHQYTMITLSEKGVFIDDGQQQMILPTQARKIADVCGAGDTVISIAALGVAIGMKLSDIAILANVAGGQVCEKVGVVPVDKTQLLQEYLELMQHSET